MIRMLAGPRDHQPILSRVNLKHLEIRVAIGGEPPHASTPARWTRRGVAPVSPDEGGSGRPPNRVRTRAALSRSGPSHLQELDTCRIATTPGVALGSLTSRSRP